MHKATKRYVSFFRVTLYKIFFWAKRNPLEQNKMRTFLERFNQSAGFHLKNVIWSKMMFCKHLRRVQPVCWLSCIKYFLKQTESFDSLNSFEQKDILGNIWEDSNLSVGSHFKKHHLKQKDIWGKFEKGPTCPWALI